MRKHFKFITYNLSYIPNTYLLHTYECIFTYSCFVLFMYKTCSVL